MATETTNELTHLPSLDLAETPPLKREPNGAVRVRGTRVSLDSVIYAFNQGCAPEAIVLKFPTLALEDVYGVIAFYLRHREEVHAYLEQQERDAEEIRRQIEEINPPDGFRERLLARQAEKSCAPS
jgi:uncharacterized protein (DUF433 family)